jgi:hypothetical protein
MLTNRSRLIEAHRFRSPYKASRGWMDILCGSVGIFRNAECLQSRQASRFMLLTVFSAIAALVSCFVSSVLNSTLSWAYRGNDFRGANHSRKRKASSPAHHHPVQVDGR